MPLWFPAYMTPPGPVVVVVKDGDEGGDKDGNGNIDIGPPIEVEFHDTFSSLQWGGYVTGRDLLDRLHFKNFRGRDGGGGGAPAWLAPPYLLREFGYLRYY